jgi:hypothetical protein
MAAPQTPTDRGYAYVFQRDGQTSVAVCNSIVDGKPQGVFAMHYNVTKVDLSPGVQLVEGDGARFSAAPVAVRGQSHVVYLSAPAKAASLAAAGLP